MNRTRLLVYATALSTMVGWSLIAPQPAQAQVLPPLPIGSLIVTVTSPAAGSPDSCTVPVSASVTIIGSLTVRGVQFKVDGANLGAEDTSAPYSVSWNTTTASNGSHTLTAVATDLLGGTWTSDPVAVTVFNDTTPPTVPTGLTATAVSSSQINLSWTASSDNVGVSGYRVYRGGTQIATRSTTSFANAGLATSTAYTYTVAAYDAAGNLSAQSSSASATTPAPPDTTPPTVSITSPVSGATVGGTTSVTASASDNVGVVGVQFLLDGANLGAEDTATPYSMSWNTTTASNGSHTLSAVARDAAGNRTTSAPVTVTVANGVVGPPAVSLENQQPGAASWQLSGQPADDVNKQIKGYASATSVNLGESITFYVTVNPAQQYTMDVYRMGWYQGLGGRLMQSIGPLQGVAQPDCPVDSATGLIECDWTASYTLTVPTSWTSGVFVVQLTNAQGYQNYITFVVRDDARVADIMFQQSVATYQAYNNYPDDSATGKSLYDFNSYGANTVTGTPRAAKVSWNRPYAGRGAGQLLDWDVYFIRWLERSGYDVKYSTDVDTHENSGRLLQSKAFLSGGHNEYWSKPMYDGVQQARVAGVHLGFFGANAVFWQVRFEASPLTGAADRVLVGYKDPRSIDPVQGPTTTILWRDPFLNRPEQQLVGVQFSSGQLPTNAPNAPYVIANSSSWVYAGTGLADGDSIPGIVGYETDSSMSSAPLPTSVAGTYQVLSQSPFTDAGGTAMTANSSIYQAPSGAWVFGAGTVSWSWGLDLANVVDPRIQRITANLLKQFGASP